MAWKIARQTKTISSDRDASSPERFPLLFFFPLLHLLRSRTVGTVESQLTIFSLRSLPFKQQLKEMKRFDCPFYIVSSYVFQIN